MKTKPIALSAAVALLVCAVGTAVAQVAPAPAPAVSAAPGVTVPEDYIIGAEDVLNIVYWRDKDMTAEVSVRPDGKVTLPLLNDVAAAGLTPAQLRDRLTELSAKYIEDPNITVVVHEMNSRKVYITGGVQKPGPYPIAGPMTVLQLISTAGGLREFANGKKIVIFRTVNGQQTTFTFNYQEVIGRKNLQQNIELKPGDTVAVPE